MLFVLPLPLLALCCCCWRCFCCFSCRRCCSLAVVGDAMQTCCCCCCSYTLYAAACGCVLPCASSSSPFCACVDKQAWRARVAAACCWAHGRSSWMCWPGGLSGLRVMRCLGEVRLV